MALVEPQVWDAGCTCPDPPGACVPHPGYGRRLGINLLGVGDCNNDGEFNNFDIVCFVDLIVNHSGCPTGTPEEGEPQALMGGGGEGEAMTSAGVFGEADGPTCPTPDAHFWQTIAQVRAYFGD